VRASANFTMINIQFTSILDMDFLTTQEKDDIRAAVKRQDEEQRALYDEDAEIGIIFVPLPQSVNCGGTCPATPVLKDLHISAPAIEFPREPEVIVRVTRRRRYKKKKENRPREFSIHKATMPELHSAAHPRAPCHTATLHRRVSNYCKSRNLTIQRRDNLPAEEWHQNSTRADLPRVKFKTYFCIMVLISDKEFG